MDHPGDDPAQSDARVDHPTTYSEGGVMKQRMHPTMSLVQSTTGESKPGPRVALPGRRMEHRLR
jgi:hypothetical protein